MWQPTSFFTLIDWHRTRAARHRFGINVNHWPQLFKLNCRPVPALHLQLFAIVALMRPQHFIDLLALRLLLLMITSRWRWRSSAHESAKRSSTRSTIYAEAKTTDKINLNNFPIFTIWVLFTSLAAPLGELQRYSWVRHYQVKLQSVHIWSALQGSDLIPPRLTPRFTGTHTWPETINSLRSICFVWAWWFRTRLPRLRTIKMAKINR